MLGPPRGDQAHFSVHGQRARVRRGPTSGRRRSSSRGHTGPWWGIPPRAKSLTIQAKRAIPGKKVAPMMPEDRIDVFGLMERKADGET